MGQLTFQATLGGAINLAGPNIATTTTFTLPSADGTNGQALTTNGTGTLAFASIAASQWTTSGSQVYFTGSIGVGTSLINSWFSDNKAIDMPAGSVFSYLTTSQFIGQNTFVNASGTQVAKNTGASAVYAQSAGIHQFASAPSVSANSIQTFTTILEIGKGKTLALESATSVSGTGISFPSTASLSTNANTLDDYEEGTWTPTQGSGVTRIGTFSSSGTYTKVGNIVHIQGNIGASTSVSVTSGGVLVDSGVPFAPNNVGETGTEMNGSTNVSGVIYVQGAYIISVTAMAATPTIYFSATYN